MDRVASGVCDMLPLGRATNGGESQTSKSDFVLHYRQSNGRDVGYKKDHSVSRPPHPLARFDDDEGYAEQHDHGNCLRTG